MSAERGQRRTRTGFVVSDKMDKTAVVAVERRVSHPKYGRYMKKTVTFKAHDEENQCNAGDEVEITESRPISKDKHWRVTGIIRKAK